MADNIPISERLVKVETKLESIKDLLIEMREDFKDYPTRREFGDVKSRIEHNETDLAKLNLKMTGMWIKVGIISGILGSILGMISGALIKYIIG